MMGQAPPNPMGSGFHRGRNEHDSETCAFAEGDELCDSSGRTDPIAAWQSFLAEQRCIGEAQFIFVGLNEQLDSCFWFFRLSSRGSFVQR
jgi:hypothetical protein